MANTIISSISLVVAGIAVAVSVFAYLMAKYNFMLSNRPYLSLQNYGVVKDFGGNTYIEPIPYRMRYMCFRTPVEVIRGELWFSISRNADVKERIYTIPIEPQIILPVGREEAEAGISVGGAWDMILKRFIQLEENKELIRQVKFTYRWAGDNKFNKAYSYYGMWKLYEYEVIFGKQPKKFHDWKLINQKIT